MTQVIVFDVGGVILKIDHNLSFRVLQDYGVPSDIAAQFFKIEYAAFSRGEISEDEFFNAVNRRLQIPLSAEQLLDAYNARTYGVDGQVVDLLEKIPAQNLAILTDTTVLQTRRERELIDLSRFSPRVFRSCEIHKLKPDADCFPYVRDQIGAQPDELVMVDDSLDKLVFAQRDGWHTIHFRDAEQLRMELAQHFPTPR